MKKSFKKATMVYMVLSMLLVLMPILSDILYNKVTEYARHTYIVEVRYIYSYAIATLLGLLMSFHLYLSLKKSTKTLSLWVLSLVFIAETLLIYYSGFVGSVIAWLFFVFTIIEVSIKLANRRELN